MRCGESGRFANRREYTDPGTQLIYMRARYYDPESGNFITRDPLETLTHEAYGYADDNPLNMTDPLGLAGILGTGIGPDVGPSVLPTPGRVVSAAGNVASAVSGFVGQHYGQIAEVAAGVGCIAGLQPELCIAATAIATGASEYQNFSSRCPSVAGGLIDLLGAAPGLQVAGADAFGLLGEGAGKIAANVLSGAVGGGAIVGGPAIDSVERQTDGSCGCQ